MDHHECISGQHGQHAPLQQQLGETEGESVWGDLMRRRELSKSNSGSRNRWTALLFGQFIALAATTQNAASFTLEHSLGKSFPFFLMLHMYVILSLYWFWTKDPTLPESPHQIPCTNIRLQAPCWYYLCLSIMDVGPNYVNLLALQHTSFTSATLLGSLTVPWSMLFCRILLGRRFSPAHFLGVILCLVGGALTIWIDIGSEGSSDSFGRHSYIGDVLAVLAATLYGAGDAAGEFWSKHVDRREYLGMLGLFGVLFCTVLVLFLEREEVLRLFVEKASLFPALGAIAVYVPSLVVYYISASMFLVTSDATLLNLSLQASNLWAICFSVVAFRDSPPISFYASLTLVVSGVFVYEIVGDETIEIHPENESESSSLSQSRQCKADYQALIENVDVEDPQLNG